MFYPEKPPSFPLDKNLQTDHCTECQYEFSKAPSEANWCFQHYDKVETADATERMFVM